MALAWAEIVMAVAKSRDWNVLLCEKREKLVNFGAAREIKQEERGSLRKMEEKGIFLDTFMANFLFVFVMRLINVDAILVDLRAN